MDGELPGSGRSGRHLGVGPVGCLEWPLRSGSAAALHKNTEEELGGRGCRRTGAQWMDDSLLHPPCFSPRPFIPQSTRLSRCIYKMGEKVGCWCSCGSRWGLKMERAEGRRRAKTQDHVRGRGKGQKDISGGKGGPRDRDRALRARLPAFGSGLSAALRGLETAYGVPAVSCAPASRQPSVSGRAEWSESMRINALGAAAGARPPRRLSSRSASLTARVIYSPLLFFLFLFSPPVRVRAPPQLWFVRDLTGATCFPGLRRGEKDKQT
ncbi:unnamed protein product [Tetraodon nigroviridis]|uniref:(spotted green pufferfish) hypothetical protein n=1 Tax=Tetraodon nigroviridis TaxID=99883 RepID=Q4S5P9_TETNG|nr:unnamed protein product [Tetraodon nigroviridis]